VSFSASHETHDINTGTWRSASKDARRNRDYLRLTGFHALTSIVAFRNTDEKP